MAGFRGDRMEDPRLRYGEGFRGNGTAMAESSGSRRLGGGGKGGREGDATAGDLLLKMLGGGGQPGHATGSNGGANHAAPAGDRYSGGKGYGGNPVPPYPPSGFGGGISQGFGRGWVPPPPPPPPPPPRVDEESSALKDLLWKVAPQARISEAPREQLSKSSARILGKVLSGASGSGSSAMPIGGSPDSWAHSSQPVQPHRPLPRNQRGELPEWARDDSPMERPPGRGEQRKPSGHSRSGELVDHDDDEDEDQFMQRWNGLFSKGSPLVEGTASDPFQDDLRRRAKVIWKKNNERTGHHSRYQKRRQQKDGGNGSDGDEGNRADSDLADGAVSLVFDASKAPSGGPPIG
eukprot:CAMPEP_0115096206 /NCGR_PEP_ID=MMETSP0227-20121206/29568_1 /TAXON_ID=89957 /ORGANISM="Polarella glacialis, Strain CCMP 1383" /LENGTH=348 /DNA_ID=CAMNT_0002489861 /DNA_START=59 /DNA_END=1105 /DNA_ORIENTATION=-